MQNCELHVSANFTTTNLVVRIKNAYLIKGKVGRSADNTQQLTAVGYRLRITYGYPRPPPHTNASLSRTDIHMSLVIGCAYKKVLTTHVHGRKKQRNSTPSIRHFKYSYYYYYNHHHLIVRVIKSRRMRRAVHVARMGRREEYTGFWWGNLRERDHLETQA